MLDCQEPGIVTVKESIDGPGEKHMLLKGKFPYTPNKRPLRLPREITPVGLSASRSWYLYDAIREHIPDIQDKDATCPRPNVPRPAKE